MNKVVTINLAGQAFQLEEGAYKALEAYLKQARATLANDPDRDEIMTDLEQAVAQKCQQYLHNDKNVITDTEAEQIVASMGPVEPAPEDDERHQAAAPEAEKRLYLIREGAMLGGVCNGIAAYFHIDVTVIRLLFVLLTFLTSGAWILAYFILMIVIPEAKTPEQLAAARGERFNTQELIERAKQKYADIGDKERWQKVANNTQPALSRAGRVISKIIRIFAAVFAIIMAVCLAWATVAWAFAMWQLGFGHVHLQDQLSTVSIWGVMVGVTAVYLLVAIPLLLMAQLSKRLAAAQPLTRQHMYWFGSACVAWIVAATVLAAVVIVNAGRLDAYHQTHAYLKLDNTHKICINDDLCGTRRDKFPGVPPNPPQLLPYHTEFLQ